MLEHNGTIFNAHRYATTVDRSVTGVHICQELTDNSIQYGSTETSIIVDSRNNRIIAADTGTGIPEDIFCDNFHTFHNEPKDASGISMAGLGSKLFYGLSDIRIALTKHNGVAYYSVWDFTSHETINNPIIDYFDKEDPPDELIPHMDLVGRFMSIESGTMIILPNIKTWGKYKTSAGRFYHALKTHYVERYGHYLKENGVNMATSFVPEKGLITWDHIKPADIFEDTKYNSVTDKSGKIEVRSWIVDANSEQSKLTKFGINIYRNNVKASTSGFLNIGQRKKKGQTISIVKASPLDYKSIRQAVFFKSDSDDVFKINHIKTQVTLGDEVEQLCATEFQKIVQEYERLRSEKQESKVSESFEDNRTTFSISELAESTAWKIANGEFSFNKASGVYKTIESLPEDGIDLIKNILTSMSPNQVNKLGVQLETTLGGNSVQQVA